MSPKDLSVAAVAADQAGALSRRQLADLGIDDQFIRRRIAGGLWRRAAPTVVALASARTGWFQDLWVGALAGGDGAGVSFDAAAALHTFDGFPRAPVDISVPHPRHLVLPGIRTHQATDLWPGMIDTRRGVPATTPARTIVDLAAILGAKRVGRILDDAVARRIVTTSEVARCFERVVRPGKRGMHCLARVLDERGPRTAPPGSVLERDFLDLLLTAGEPAPVRQFVHPMPTSRLGFVDFADVEAKLLIEIDGRAYHSRLADLARDRARDSEAASLGWQTLRIGYVEIHDDPASVVRVVSATRSVRLGQLVPGSGVRGRRW